MDLGADTLTTLRHIILPQLGTALLAGGILAFALSVDELIVTTFTAGTDKTLPIWLMGQLGRPREAAITNVVALAIMVHHHAADPAGLAPHPRRRRQPWRRALKAFVLPLLSTHLWISTWLPPASPPSS